MIRLSSQNRYRHGVGAALEALEKYQGLPLIRGRWLVADPYATNRDYINGDIYPNIQTAYDQCTDGRGDGIVVMSGGTTAAHTTSDLKSPLTWSKSGITVVGVCAPTRVYQRARISNKIVTYTATTISYTADHTISDSAGGFLTAGFEAGQYLAITNASTNTNDHAVVAEGGSADFIKISTVTATTITTTSTSAHVTTEAAATAGEVVLTSYNWFNISVTGNNNSFHNIFINQEDNTAYALMSLRVTGARNYFSNVHSAIGLASAATILTRSLSLVAAEDNTFEGCTFGTDTVDRGNNATYDILLSGAVARNRFIDCATIRHTSVGVANFAVYLNATTGGRPTQFHNCVFTNWSSASGNAVQTAAFGYNGAGNDDVWLTGNTQHPGYGSTGLGGVVWVGGANVAAGVGGVLTTQS
jgi:hypothetical protein